MLSEAVKGQIVAHGSHEELLETSEIYADIYSSQLVDDSVISAPVDGQVIREPEAVRQGGRIHFPAGAVIQFWNGGPGLTQRLFRTAEGRGIGVVYDALVVDLLTTAEGRVQFHSV